MGGEDCFAGLPGSFKVGAQDLASHSQECFGSRLTPEHPRLFHTPTNDGFTSGFNDSASNKVSLGAEVAVSGAPGIGFEVGQFTPGGFDALGIQALTAGFEKSARGGEDGLEAVILEFSSPAALKGFGFLGASSLDGPREDAEVLGGVIEVEDLHRSGKVEPGVFPNPGSSVPKVDGLCDPAMAPTKGFVM